MILLAILCSIFLVFNVLISVGLVKASLDKRYVQKIGQKFGRDEFEKYQVFFDKEKLRDALTELKIPKATSDMLLSASTYTLMLSWNTADLYYSYPPKMTTLLSHREATSKQLFQLIEKAAIQPKPYANVLYFSKYKAGG